MSTLESSKQTKNTWEMIFVWLSFLSLPSTSINSLLFVSSNVDDNNIIDVVWENEMKWKKKHRKWSRQNFQIDYLFGADLKWNLLIHFISFISLVCVLTSIISLTVFLFFQLITFCYCDYSVWSLKAREQNLDRMHAKLQHYIVFVFLSSTCDRDRIWTQWTLHK